MKVTDAAGISWRQKLETQRGAVLANELKNNANKLAKWTAAAHISGTDMIKLGYVTRATPKDNFNHVILGTQVNLVLCCALSRSYDRLTNWDVGLTADDASASADGIKAMASVVPVSAKVSRHHCSKPFVLRSLL